MAAVTKDPQTLAEAVVAAMLAKDRASRALGMEVDGVGPGQAIVSMTVRGDMVNGLAVCHGGLVTTLADSAFAFACNSHDEATVASGFTVDLLRPAHEGDRLTATAREVSRAGRTGVYDVEVTNQKGERVAVMRGRSYRLSGRKILD